MRVSGVSGGGNAMRQALRERERLEGDRGSVTWVIRVGAGRLFYIEQLA